MDQHLIKPENPAKTFLRKYRALVKRQESIQRAIEAAYDRAYSCTQQLRPIRVQSSNVYDRMAEDVSRIADETAQLFEEGDTKAALRLMKTINAEQARRLNENKTKCERIENC